MPKHADFPQDVFFYRKAVGVYTYLLTYHEKTIGRYHSFLKIHMIFGYLHVPCNLLPLPTTLNPIKIIHPMPLQFIPHHDIQPPFSRHTGTKKNPPTRKRQSTITNYARNLHRKSDNERRKTFVSPLYCKVLYPYSFSTYLLFINVRIWTVLTRCLRRTVSKLPAKMLNGAVL